MEKIVVVFINQTPFIVRLKIERTYFISFTSLYPLRGINGYYFNDKLNFYEQDSYPEIKAFLFSNLLPYQSINSDYESLSSSMKTRKLDAVEAKKSYMKTLSEIDLKFFSKNSLKNLKKRMTQYLRYQKLPFEILESDQNIHRNMDLMTEIIINERVDDVLFLLNESSDFENDEFLEIGHLTTLSFVHDYVFQDLGKFLESGSYLNGAYNREYWQEFFQKKFDGFSEQQKFSIFYKSLGENPIYVYNEAVQNWSEVRY